MSGMRVNFPTSGDVYRRWGGRPRPQPTPWSASSRWHAPDSSTGKRDVGVPRGPGGPPHHLRNVADFTKLADIVWATSAATWETVQ
jgi:hypothetical protein